VPKSLVSVPLASRLCLSGVWRKNLLYPESTGCLSVQSLPSSTFPHKRYPFFCDEAPVNHLVSRHPLGHAGETSISALSLHRQLGVSYNTAWSIKQKLMQVMKERDDSKPLSGVIQLDDVYWGGEHHGGKRGRGSSNKTTFVAAVSVNEKGHPITMNMNVVNGFRSKEIARWAKRHLSVNSHVVSDGLACFSAVKDAGCQHTSIVTGGGPECVSLESFTWVNTMIGNVKRSMNGAYHAINHKHLPRYLAEFCYRFNRRFVLEDMLPRLYYVAARTPPMPIRLLKLAEVYG